MSSEKQEPAIAKDAVLVVSSQLPADTPVVAGYDWDEGVDYDRLLQTYLTSGFQATNFGKAVNEINNMVRRPMQIPNIKKRTSINFEMHLNLAARLQTNPIEHGYDRLL